MNLAENLDLSVEELYEVADPTIDELDKHDARECLLDFVKYTKKDYIVNWHHELICEELDDFLADPDRKRLMVFVAPRTGKSEIISRRLPAYYLGRNPNGQVIATSYGADLATSMSRDVQRIIDTEKYAELFPDTKLNTTNVKTTSRRNYIRTADKFEIVDKTGVYKCAGIGGALTGFGASLAIIDDPIKDMQEAMSPKRKQVIYEWYQSVLTTRLVGEEKVIIILTRWAEDDLAGRLLAEAETNPDADQWEVISLPTLYTEDHPYKHPRDPRTVEGQPIWPLMMDEKKAKRKKASAGSKVWESLYQQNPTPAGGSIFRPSWFQYFKETPDFDYKCASWDFTFKDTQMSDYVVGGVWGVAGPNRYLLYLIREKLDFPGSIKAMLKVNMLYKGLRYNLVEDKANGPAVIATLKKKINGLIAYNPKQSKEGRANAASPQYESGNVWLPDKYYEANRTRYAWAWEETQGGAEVLDHFVKEHQVFPFGANDDCVDMTTQFLIKVGGGISWMDELVGDAKEEVSQQDQYTEKVAEAMGWDTESWS